MPESALGMWTVLKRLAARALPEWQPFFCGEKQGYAALDPVVHAADAAKYFLCRDCLLPEATDSAPSLEVPAIVSGNDYPELSASSSVAVRPGLKRMFFFEFDTVSSFDSLNFLRLPKTYRLNDVLRDPSEMWQRRYRVSTLCGAVDLDPWYEGSFRFSFRAKLLYPLCGKGRAMSIQKVAALLGDGMTEEQCIEEANNWIYSCFDWGNSEGSLQPDIVLARRYGGCGDLARLLAYILRLNGILTRGVGGYSPLLKPHYPGGGHTALEVRAGDWRYCDPYLGIFARDMSTVDLVSHREAWHFPVFRIREEHREQFGEAAYLADIFTERSYFSLMLPMEYGVTPASAVDDEASIGMLEIPESRSKPRIAIEPFEVFVRCRYIDLPFDSAGEVIPADGDRTVVSEWAEGKFLVNP